MAVPTPRSWNAVFAEGLARHRAGDVASARTLYERATSLQPGRADDDPAPARLLALLLADAGDHDAALRWVRRALALAPDAAVSHAAHGRVLARRQCWGEAASAYRAALAREPSMAAAQSGLGSALLAAGNADAACDSFEAALRLRPDDAHARLGLVAALRACASLPRLEAACRSQPQSGEVWQALGQRLFAASRWQDAASALAEAARRLPGDAAVLHDWGTALIEAGEPAAAAAVLDRAVQAAPGRAASWHNLGSSRQAAGDLAAAMVAYGRAYALDPASLPRIAQELAAGNPGRVWLRAADLARCLAGSAAAERPAALAEQVATPGEDAGEGG